MMSAIGQQLRRERENRGLRRVDVAKATALYAHQLAALEHDDFGELDDDGQVEACVRSYAEYLGLDPEALVAELARSPAPAKPSPRVETPRVSDPPRRSGWAFGTPLVATVSALLVIVAWAVGTRLADRGKADTSAMPPTGELARLDPPTANEPVAAATAAVVAEPREETPPPPAAAAAAAPVNALSVIEHGVGTGVRDRRLVGAADRFVAGSRVWFWTRVRGGAPGRTIRHVWMHEGRVIETIPLEIGSPNWRTYSRKTLYGVGDWAVEVRDESGVLLARHEFTCAAP